MVIGIAHLQPIVALVAGILILIIPRLLNFIVAAYLIFIGIMASASSTEPRPSVPADLRATPWGCF